jgi:DNA helicase-2/ATP-dependent DNA helicase PcrA
MPLNSSQKSAIEQEGVQLILAGPGSGKTRVVTQKIVHLTNSGVKPENILALTFSEKAAAEMADRLEQEIDISDLTIGTFHSFCLDLLKDNVLDSGISFTSGIISGTNQLVWGLRNLDSFAFEHIEIGNNERYRDYRVKSGLNALHELQENSRWLITFSLRQRFAESVMSTDSPNRPFTVCLLFCGES